MQTAPPIAALIVAAGRGTRAGGPVPKQWQTLGDRPVLMHAIAAFGAHPRIGPLAVVLHPDDIPRQAALVPEGIDIVPGGETRQASVVAGLRTLRDRAGSVLIHDGARPFVTTGVIDRVIAALDAGHAAAPAVPLADALWVGRCGFVTGGRDRTDLFRAQTPQGFRLAEILGAHDTAPPDAPDDVAVARAAGIPVRIVEGDPANFKITTPEDMDRARRLQEMRMQDVRVGNGFDVHRFGPGDHVVLCGVAVPFARGLQGHSDADVGLHALTDAIFGALAKGDIGTHFPPSDPKWEGADSAQFLAHAATLARTEGYRLGHLDVTLICEQPKIGPHAAGMRARVAAIAGIGTDRVSVKATTTERLGFAGREEGIAAMATATLVRP